MAHFSGKPRPATVLDVGLCVPADMVQAMVDKVRAESRSEAQKPTGKANRAEIVVAPRRSFRIDIAPRDFHLRRNRFRALRPLLPAWASRYHRRCAPDFFGLFHEVGIERIRVVFALLWSPSAGVPTMLVCFGSILLVRNPYSTCSQRSSRSEMRKARITGCGPARPIMK